MSGHARLVIFTRLKLLPWRVRCQFAGDDNG
jgi:hypothetical protein